MKFVTLVARYPGKCKRCGEQFPVGTRIRYGGRGATYHMAAECPKGNVEHVHDDDAAFVREALRTIEDSQDF